MFRFYYVKSGQYENRTLSGSKREAALKFIEDILKEEEEVKLGKIVIVDVKPITEEESSTAFFESTSTLAKELGVEIEDGD